MRLAYGLPGRSFRRLSPSITTFERAYPAVERSIVIPSEADLPRAWIFSPSPDFFLRYSCAGIRLRVQ